MSVGNLGVHRADHAGLACGAAVYRGDHMPSDETAGVETQVSGSFRWFWVGAGVALGAVLIGSFIFIVDPELQRPASAGLMVTLSLVLIGMMVGYHSVGYTIREAAIVGVILFILTAAVMAVGFRVGIPVLVWLLAPFYSAAVAAAGGWVGEILQGTLKEAHIDRVVDWPWILVSVVIGFTLCAYVLAVTNTVFDLSSVFILAIFAGSFFVTGYVVGLFSPGMTVVEPAIAAAGMIALNSAFVSYWFETPPPVSMLVIGFGGSVLLALLGGFLGEVMQRKKRGT